MKWSARSLGTLLLFLLAWTAPALHAESTVLSGDFDGSEAEAASFFGYCPGATLAYQVHQIQVTQNGDYQFDWWGTAAGSPPWPGLTAQLYAEGFDPSNAAGKVAPSAPMGWFSGVRLKAGATYDLVVQRYCDGDQEGPWAVAFTGPGRVVSDRVVELPEFSTGELKASDPTMTSDCGSLWGGWGWGEVQNAYYKQTGPIRVHRTGNYFYAPAVINNGALVCLMIYTAPVDPSHPQAGRLAALGGYAETVTLDPDTDYYFVSIWSGGEFDDDRSNDLGEFLHMLLPPREFRINPGLAGSWFDPDTPGEGFFLSVFDHLNRLFLVNATFNPDSGAGDAFGHRWLTASGPFDGASADLEASLTEGGGFNSAEPLPIQSEAGGVSVDFFDCTSGQVTFDAGSGGHYPGTSVPIQRLAEDSVHLCESYLQGSGKPGPL
jgi:hypothetical protein